jgi:hypothetical protein
MEHQITMEAHAADRAARAQRAAGLWRLRKATRGDLRSATAAGLHRAALRLERPTSGAARIAEDLELRKAA